MRIPGNRGSRHRRIQKTVDPSPWLSGFLTYLYLSETMQICNELTIYGQAFTDLCGEVTRVPEGRLQGSDSASKIMNKCFFMTSRG